nr:MAG: L2 protein [Varecia variegata papillomavirus 2]
MLPAKRRKRDTVENLYRQCQVTGNCPDDVKNKVEGKTIADWILRLGSALTYFGGLGIGTGRGSGGQGGYVPLAEGGGVRVGGGPTVLRPAVPVEPVGPIDGIPVEPPNAIDSVLPSSPSVVPLEEGSAVDIPEVHVLSEVDPVSDVSGTPNVTAGGDGHSAVLEVTPTPSNPVRTRVTGQQYNNPAYVAFSAGTPTAGEMGPGDSVLVSFAEGGRVIGADGGELIELDTLNTPDNYALDEAIHPRHSTPSTVIGRFTTRVRGFYSRAVERVPVSDAHLLTRPSMLLGAQFDNPVFEGDLEGTVELPASAPSDSLLSDVAVLHRRTISDTPHGHIRVSRLGSRSTIQTRSGLRIGARVYFYQDLSSIEASEGLELVSLGQHSGDATVVHATAESAFIDVDLSDVSSIVQAPGDSAVTHVDFPDTGSTYSESALLDPAESDFSHSQLVFGPSRSQNVVVPDLIPSNVGSFVVGDVDTGYYVSYPHTHRSPVLIDPLPSVPAVILEAVASDDFYPHPSVLRRRRKRKRMRESDTS